MKIKLIPQIWSDRIHYSFDKDIVSVSIGGVIEEFDFSGLPDGVLELIDPQTGKEVIKTSLEVQPIVSAKKVDGVLYLELLNWISEDATHEEKSPEWIDAVDYKTPEHETQKDEGTTMASEQSEESTPEKNNSNSSSEPENWGDF